MCANTILKIFFITEFLLLCLGIEFLFKADNRRIEINIQYPSKLLLKQEIDITSYKPLDLF